MDKFEIWFNAINEDLSQEPVVNNTAIEITNNTDTQQISDTPRNNMIGDIDAIMHSLETLASELTEELQVDEELLEASAVAKTAGVAGLAVLGAVGLGAKKFYDWKFVAPKARKAQSGVNKMNVKIAGVENALKNAPKEQKEKIQDKVDAMKSSASDLQAAIDKKYGEKSSIVVSALDAEKKLGKMEVLKVSIGEATPKQQAEMKDQLKKLKTAVAKDEAAFAQSEPDDESKKELEDAIAKQKAEKKKETEKKRKEELEDAESEKEHKDKLAKAKGEEVEKKEETPTTTTTTTTTSDPTGEDKAAKIEADIKTINNNIEDAKKSADAKSKELEQAERDVKVGKGSDEKIQQLKKAIEDEKEDITELKGKEKSLKAELSKMTAKESLIYRANEVSLLDLATEISEKVEWQLDNTTLYNKYNTIIKKAEYDSIIKESLTVQDKFSKLI